ncbi:SAP domain-containing ribonucleo -like [Brachionus plicatilis]|uniref:SAP domain-containing ribonucleo-like n=1 Tax=Brachionus plicatilis TaxID=10195 RepID=A0A3M7R4K8_BRAPC|nr:SAP domain-containing ribonucleo -like [Brachionus plicatilis]
MSEIEVESTKNGEENIAVSPEKNQENELVDSGAKIDIESTKKMSESERLEQRLKKFGAQNDNTKKEERAKRFGLSASGGEPSLAGNKLKKRAERFGTAPSTPTGGDKEALEKRAKRFGSSESKDEPKNEVLTKRKERFGIVDEDAKKKQRSQRFESK